VLIDVSALTSVLSGDGAESRWSCWRGVSPDDLSKATLPFAHTREIDVGHAAVCAPRAHELRRRPGCGSSTCRSRWRATSYLALHAAGTDLNSDGRRLLRHRRACASKPAAAAWGAELGPDETPFEANLMFAVKLDKTSDFIGRDATAGRARQAAAQRSS